MQVTEIFKRQITPLWGPQRYNSDCSYAIADVCLNELFRHANLCNDLDLDGQVRAALRIGILVGSMRMGTLDEFIVDFEDQFLNREE